MRRPIILASAALLLPLALPGCHRPPPPPGLDAVDNQLVNGAVVSEANGQAELRSAIRVDSAAKPALATRGSAENGCIEKFGPTLAYDKAWAAKLPAAIPVKPGATLSEAAGHDGEGCTIRIASFTVPGDRDATLAWYAEKAKAAGYDAGRADKGADHILAGSRGAAAFYIIAGPTDGGTTPVDYVWAEHG